MNKIYLTLALLFVSLMIPSPAQAVCPVCTMAVGAGLGISRWLGIDDVITALATSSGMWLADWVKNKGFKSWFQLLSTFLFHFFMIVTLYILDISGDPLNTLWGFDKIVLGVVIGTAVFFIAAFSDRAIKTANDDQVLVYYQKVILPMFFLSITSFIFHLITN